MQDILYKIFNITMNDNQHIPQEDNNTIVKRLRFMLKKEEMTVYRFCQLNGMSTPAVDYVLKKAKDENNVGSDIILKFYHTFKPKYSLLWILTGDSEKEINYILKRVTELEEENIILKDDSRAYNEIKKIVIAHDEKRNL